MLSWDSARFSGAYGFPSGFERVCLLFSKLFIGYRTVQQGFYVMLKGFRGILNGFRISKGLHGIVKVGVGRVY